jgi:hypothetical protein
MKKETLQKHIEAPLSGRTSHQRSMPRRVALLAVLLGLGLGTAAWAGSGDSEHHPDQGGPLGLFQDLYWRWTYGGLNLPVDANSNAVVHDVVMMAIPSTPGDGTPGTQAVTLDSDQRWMLPLSMFKTLDIKFTVDGKTVVSTKNVLEYYSKFSFNPAIPFVAPPTAAIICLEGVGVLHGPLSPGKHTLKVDVKNTQTLPPNFGGGVIEYHNTWNVTVNPGP